MFNHIVDFSSWVIIVVFVGNFLRRIIEGYINCSNDLLLDADKLVEDLKSAHPILETEFDENKFGSLLSYNRIKSIFSYFASGISTTMGTCFLIIGLSPTIIEYVCRLDFTVPVGIWSSMVVVALFSSIVMFPFKILSDKIEKRFGYSTMTNGLMMTDTVKGLLVGMTVNGFVIFAVSVGLDYLGRLNFYTVLYFILGLFLIVWFLQIMSAYFIMPMFNKFSPLDDGELKSKLTDLATNFNIKLENVYVMDGSRRSKKGNAFCLSVPFGPTKLVLFDTLLNELTVDEIVAVMGHEFAHKIHRHTLLSYVSMLLKFVILSYIAIFMIYDPYIYHCFGYTYVDANNIDEYTLVGFMLVGTLLESVGWIFTPIESFISRVAEYDADRTSVRYIGDKESMITSLAKIYGRSGSVGIVNRSFELWFMSHPSLLHRINAINSMKV